MASQAPVSALAALKARQPAIVGANLVEERIFTQSDPRRAKRLKRDVDGTPKSVKRSSQLGGLEKDARHVGQVPLPLGRSIRAQDLERIVVYNTSGEENEDISDSENETKVKSQVRELSNFMPGDRHGLRVHRDSVALRLHPGEKLVILGQYDIWVKRGAIMTMGAVLPASPVLHRVYAPATHGLPSIECFSDEFSSPEAADLEILNCKAGAKVLSRVSPLFGRIWSEPSTPRSTNGPSTVLQPDSFSIMGSSTEDALKRPLRRLEIYPEWNKVISNLIRNQASNLLRVMVCGPKSSGKSSFARLFANRMVTRKTQISTKEPSGVSAQYAGLMLLDLDPGQPEFAPPGQLSLISLKQPNLGPPFSHPSICSTTGNQIIQAHNIAANSPRDDPLHYTRCVENLMDCYRGLPNEYSEPLLVNTPGWILGTGLEILSSVISYISPTHIVYMSQEGPEEVVEAIQQAGRNARIWTLPSQPTEVFIRHPSDQRAMQTMSYFHVSQPIESHTTWDTAALAETSQLSMKYSGATPDIFGVMILGEHISPELISTVLEGSIVAVVAIHDQSAVRSDDGQPMGSSHTAEILPLNICRTPSENIPYIQNGLGYTIPLDPRNSRSLGLAFVAGIDRDRQTFRLTTPIPSGIWDELRAKDAKVVLVRGTLDAPLWAHTQGDTSWNYSQRSTSETDEDAQGSVHSAPKEEKLQKRGNASPWVRMIEGGEGRGADEKIWRVRRDLKMTEAYTSD